MRHKNSVFHQVLAHVPWGLFDRLVGEHNADKHVRRLPTKTQFLALLYGQFSAASSLRGLVSSFASHAQRLYHLGAKPVKRSSLSDANAQRPCAMFAALFAALVARVHPKLARQIGECVLLIDSTSCRLNCRSENWAHFSAGVCGAKMHVVYDPDADCPIYAAITPTRTNDITAAKAMPIRHGATYVFDLGYYDYAWWAELDAAGCRLVTRFKTNTPLTIESERLVAPGGPVLSDRTGYLPARQTKNRNNPMKCPVREIKVRIETGKVLRILSNDLTSSAEEIADLYKRRWAIELFFRWVKQTLKIRHFVGIGENAVRIQIAVALIAFLLLRLAQRAHQLDCSPLLFARLVQANLMHCKTLAEMLQPGPEPPPEPDHRQAVLQWA